MIDNQDALIDAVAAANTRTVVVLNNGAPVLMPWADRVAGILQMWYPGQEGAEATAAILLGEASPGGRLPVTFPRRAEDAPTARPERPRAARIHGGCVVARYQAAPIVFNLIAASQPAAAIDDCRGAIPRTFAGPRILVTEFSPRTGAA